MESIVCPLCVQWRCANCKDDDCYGECSDNVVYESYWPDGSVAKLTQDEYCDSCAQAIKDYEKYHKEFPY